jgi:MoaA/NifB/PqqE/SkfB family radical SAM enzyme
LQIEPTRRCNLNCKICMRPGLNETSALLSLEDFRKVLDSSHIRHVALHGWGEPLLNPILFQMVRYAESQGVSTEVTTNATLLQKNTERIFASGLSSIVFGIHNKENLPIVVPQIKELIAQRNREKLRKPKTYIDIVIYHENQNHIADIMESAAEVSIDAVVLHRIFDIRQAGPETGYISVQDEKMLFARVRNLARKLRLKLYLPPEPSIPCRAIKQSLFVTCEGKITPCPYLPVLYIGNALNGGLKEVISSERYRSFVINMKNHPVCSKCPLGSTHGNFYTSESGLNMSFEVNSREIPRAQNHIHK